VILWVVPTLGAWAQCPDPVDRIITFPADGTNNVPINAVLHAEFPSTQSPASPPTWRILDSEGRDVAGDEDGDGLTSTFTPEGGLEPRSAYYARVSVAATGQFLNFAFNTGAGSDRSAPTFSGLSDLSWEYRDENWLLEECSIWRGDAIIYRLEFREASDDVSAEHLCYHVYQTSGPGITNPVLIARLRYPGDDLRLLIPADTGEGELCFRVEVRDITGRFDGNRRELCTEAVVGALFQDACSVSGAGAGAPRMPFLAFFLAALTLVALRRRRGRGD
jgi:MYXO-CTERM domain-containing protein